MLPTSLASMAYEYEEMNMLFVVYAAALATPLDFSQIRLVFGAELSR